MAKANHRNSKNSGAGRRKQRRQGAQNQGSVKRDERERQAASRRERREAEIALRLKASMRRKPDGLLRAIARGAEDDAAVVMDCAQSSYDSKSKVALAAVDAAQAAQAAVVSPGERAAAAAAALMAGDLRGLDVPVFDRAGEQAARETLAAAEQKAGLAIAMLEQAEREADQAEREADRMLSRASAARFELADRARLKAEAEAKRAQRRIDQIRSGRLKARDGEELAAALGSTPAGLASVFAGCKRLS